ncbi:ATP/GTP-binding protein [Streptomyces sp. NPDC051217]|uniref:ATP/GTP-binding protein n=1 Tax=Streptomyces sp. NPDC051217 TaxID=3365644 RepID=UPI00379056BE
MLLRFRVANWRSLRDEQELSFVVPPDEPTAAAREVELVDGPVSVFPLVGIFGANASGKSNVLDSLAAMRGAVLNSYAQWASYEGTEREVFALDAKSAAEPTFYEVDVAIDGVRWTYGFELGESRVESEWVHSYPLGHQQEWMDRDTSRKDVYRWPSSRVKDRAQLVRRTRPNALLLSTAGTDNHPQLSPLFHWFRRLWHIGPETERLQREAFTTSKLAGDQGHRIKELLRVADLGITDAVLDPSGKGAGAVRLLHRSAAGDVALDWQRESFGTRSWFALLGPLLLALDDGAVLLLDELDASLHPRFAAEVVRLFRDPLSNPKGAQLIFTSHDATVLSSPSGERLLDPGQVWFTEKDKDGATELYPLSAMSPGAGEDLTKSYLEGAFGGVPSLLEGQIVRRLGAGWEEAETAEGAEHV